MTTKTELDYLNYDDLNEIENKILEYTAEVSRITYIPPYSARNWRVNDLPFIQEIDRIEKGIYNLGYYYNKPKGWLPTKEWITQDNEYPIKSFSYRDWNRWVNNLDLIDLIAEITIWNGPSYIDWNIQSNEEWEEI